MATWVNLLDIVYPVGSIYQSTKNTSPASIVGGTWSAIQGRFLLGQSSSYAVNSQNGKATVTLTLTQIPAHDHKMNVNYAFAGWTGTSPGAYMTKDPKEWFDSYSGEWKNISTTTDGLDLIANSGGGLLTKICHPIMWSISGDALLNFFWERVVM